MTTTITTTTRLMVWKPQYWCGNSFLAKVRVFVEKFHTEIHSYIEREREKERKSGATDCRGLQGQSVTFSLSRGFTDWPLCESKHRTVQLEKTRQVHCACPYV